MCSIAYVCSCVLACCVLFAVCCALCALNVFVCDEWRVCVLMCDSMCFLWWTGCGKTTLIRLLAGLLKPDGDSEVPELTVSYKPQKISPKWDGSVRSLLFKKLGNRWQLPQFVTDVTKPLNLDPLLDLDVRG